MFSLKRTMAPRHALLFGKIALTHMCMPVGVAIRAIIMNTYRNLLEVPRGNSIDIEMAVACRMRARCSSAIGTSLLSKHKIGYATSWKTDFPWYIPFMTSPKPLLLVYCALFASDMA